MKRCDACHTREAMVHITKIHGTDVENVHLCEACAAERGINVQISMMSAPDEEDEEGLEPEPVGLGLPHDASELKCPLCSFTLADIEESKRIGCAMCWTTFETPLRDLLQRVQGSSTHLGKVYTGKESHPENEEVTVRRQRDRLQRAMQAAVAGERFEEAALMRDQLRKLD